MRRVGLGVVAVAVLAIGLYLATRVPEVGPSAAGPPASQAERASASDPASPSVITADLPVEAGVDAGPEAATLGGEVLDGRAAVAGADVTARLRDGNPPAGCASTASARSVAGGGFELGLLCPGLYDVIAWRGTRAASLVIRLAHGDAERVTLELSSRTRLSVMVQTGPKAPVAGATVTVQDKATGYLLTGKTDLTGATLLEPLLAHTYEVRVAVDDALPSYVPNTTLSPGDNSLTVTVRRGAFVSGQVLQPSGVPAEGLTVLLYRAGKRGERGSRSKSGDSADGGLFRIGPLEAGAYWATTDDGRWLPASERAVVPGPPVSILLKTGPSLHGEVLEADGTRVESCRVNAWAADFSVDVRCDSGTFVFPSVRAGELRLMAKMARVDAGGDRMALKEVTISPGPGPVYATIQLEEHHGVISGRCSRSGDYVIALTEQAAANFRWSRDRRDVRGSVHNTKCGPEFTLTGLEPGRYRVSCSSDLSSGLTAATGATDVNLQCAPIGGLRLRVVDEAGQPIERFGFRAGAFEHHPNGVYTDDKSEPGEQSLSLHAPGFLPLQRRIDIPASGTLDLGDVVMSRRGGLLTGRVLDAADGAPIAQAEVSLSVPMGNAVRGTHTLADGTFTLNEVPRSAGALIANHAEFEAKTVSLVDGQSSVEVKLKRAVVIRGSVVTLDGQVSADLSVSAYCGNLKDTTEVEDGRFELGGLEPCAAWKVRVEGSRELTLSVFDIVTVAAPKPGIYRVDLVERSSGVSFDVQVVDWRGVPVAARVYLVDAALPSPQSVAAHRAFLSQNAQASDGLESPFSFARVKPGQWRLIAFPTGERAAVIEQPLNVTPGMQSVVSMTFPQGLKRLPP